MEDMVDMESEKQIKNIFGNNLVTLRTAMGLTQDQLAGMIDSNQPTISEIESGTSNPRLTTVWKIILSLKNRHNSPEYLADFLFKGGKKL